MVKTGGLSLGIIAVLALALSSFSQDRVYLNSKKVIKCKVLEINDKAVKFSPLGAPETSFRNGPLKDVFLIIYENGKQVLIKPRPGSTEMVFVEVVPAGGGAAPAPAKAAAELDDWGEGGFTQEVPAATQPAQDSLKAPKKDSGAKAPPDTTKKQKKKSGSNFVF